MTILIADVGQMVLKYATLELDCRWTTSKSSRISHFGRGRSTRGDIDANNVLFNLLVIDVTSLTPIVSLA